MLFWFSARVLISSLPVAAGFGHTMGGFAAGESHGTFGPHHEMGFRHGNPFHNREHHFFDHRFVHRDHDDHFFRRHNRFFFGFDFVAFGFPYWWYPYYEYPYDYAYSDYSPVYDYRYWSGLATAVQIELAGRSYYHGPIDGVIGSESRQAIRAFQAAQGLLTTGLIDPELLKALKLHQVPHVA
jgi:hypothetical protein